MVTYWYLSSWCRQFQGIIHLSIKGNDLHLIIKNLRHLEGHFTDIHSSSWCRQFQGIIHLSIKGNDLHLIIKNLRHLEGHFTDIHKFSILNFCFKAREEYVHSAVECFTRNIVEQAPTFIAKPYSTSHWITVFSNTFSLDVLLCSLSQED